MITNPTPEPGVRPVAGTRGAPLAHVIRWRNAVCSPESGLTSTERLVALVLTLYANPDGTSALMSQETLAVACGLSERSVRTALAKLKAAGWCSSQRIKRRGDRTGWCALSWTATMPARAGGWSLPSTRVPEAHSDPSSQVPEPVADTQAGVEATEAIKYRQLTTEVPEPVADYLERAPRKSEEQKQTRTEQPSAPAAVSIPLRDGTEYVVTEDQIRELAPLCAPLDALVELKKAQAWCINTPERRKTRKGARRFVTSWLLRATRMAATQGTKTRCSPLQRDFTDVDYTAGLEAATP